MSLENLLVHRNGALIIDLGMCLRIPWETSKTNTPPSRASTPNLTASFGNLQLNNATTSNAGRSTTRSANNNFNAHLPGTIRPRQLMTPQGTCGKWIYMSPEIYQNKLPFDGFTVDMWAAGVILFLMVTGFPPWERACQTDERFKYMTAGYLVQMLTEWEIGLSADVMDLLQRMLFLDPKDRLCLQQVRAHPWMAPSQPREAPIVF